MSFSRLRRRVVPSPSFAWSLVVRIPIVSNLMLELEGEEEREEIR